MFKEGDVVICTDTSGFSELEVEVGKEYVVESVHNMCYMRLVGMFDMQKMWRFKLKEIV